MELHRLELPANPFSSAAAQPMEVLAEWHQVMLASWSLKQYCLHHQLQRQGTKSRAIFGVVGTWLAEQVGRESCLEGPGLPDQVLVGLWAVV